jgi:hypothetical protein
MDLFLLWMDNQRRVRAARTLAIADDIAFPDPPQHPHRIAASVVVACAQRHHL